MKPLIISFASKGREDYLKMSEKLYASVKEHWKYDYLFYTMDGSRDSFEGIKITQITELPQPSKWKCNPHSITPYQFKFGLIEHALEMGYNKIIWCDSSISIEKCPLHLLEQSNKGIMAFHNLGHETINYISDECKKILNCTELDLLAPQTWGGCIGFDFTKPEVKRIFDEIVSYSKKGAFDNTPNYPNHRHDQAVMSVLFHREGIVLYNYGHIVCYNPHGKEHFEFGTYYTFVYGKN
jgi:hypothetical protein